MEEKIKMIISDVDSTLLMPGQGKIGDRVFDMIEKLDLKGISFCAASGRTYEELYKLFYKVKDKIYFIALDGGITLYKGKVLNGSSILKRNTELTLSRMENSDILFYAKDKTYFKWSDNDYEKEILNPYHKNIFKIKSADDIKEEIYKITFFKEHSPQFDRFKSYVKTNGIFDSLYEDKTWCDFINMGNSKGSAISYLMDYLEISANEVMAFGDNTNDVDMLKKVKYSFAVENAKQIVKSVARHTCKDVVSETERVIFNGGLCN